MPSKTYRYDVKIITRVENQTKSGVDGVERELTRTEKRVQKQIAILEKYQKSIDAADKAMSAMGKSSNSGGVTVLEKTLTRTQKETQKLKVDFDALKRSIEEVERIKAKIGGGSRGGGGSGGSGGGDNPSGGGSSNLFKAVLGGNLASRAITESISLATSLTTSAKDLGVEAVNLAGNFEVTTNSLKVFTGSTRLAKQELTEIEDLASNTAGLRLVSAQEGYQQLRALGFQANIAKGFIKELGEEKILSGADDESLKRVIFNFAQIASGGQKVSQEMREIVTQMPTLKRAFADAFGTTDPKKIQEFFDKDTNAAFQKLIDAMAKGEAAAGGYNDAWGKLVDAVIASGRAFGEPILNPLTSDTKDLTAAINENRNSFTDWGQHVADVIRGVSVAQEKYNSSEFFLNPFIRGVKESTKEEPNSARGQAQSYLYEKYKSADDYLNNLFPTLAQLGERQRKADLASKPKVTNLADLRQSEDKIFSPEALKKREQQEAALRVVQENAKKRSLELLKIEADEANTILKNRFDVEQAMRDTSVRYTAAQEIKFLTESAASKNRYLQSEIGRITGFYDKQLALQNLSEEESTKLTVEKNKALSDLNKDLKLNAINTFAEIQKQELKIYEERRQAAIAFKGLQIRESQFNFDNKSFDISRSIEKETISAAAGYAKLKELTNANLSELSQLTRDNYDIQLKDKSLTDEQIVNLTRQRDLDLKGLAEKNRRDILQIEDDKRQKQLQVIEKFYQNAREIQGIRFDNAQLTFENLIGGGFSQSVFTNELDKIKNGVVTFRDFRQSILDTKLELDKLNRGKLGGDGGLDALISRTKELGYKSNLADEEASELQAKNALVSEGLKTRGELEERLNKIYDERNKFLQNNPDIWGLEKGAQLIELLKTADFSKIENYTKLQKELVNLQFDKDANDLWKQFDENIAKQLNASGAELEQLRQQADVLLSLFNALGIKKKAALQDVTNNSPEGIKSYLDDLETNAFRRGQIVYDANVSMWKETRDLAEENIALESKFYENSELWAERRKNALLNYEREVFESRQNSLINIEILNRKIADKSVFNQVEAQEKILSHIEQTTKSASDIYADAFIDAFDRIGNKMDDVFDKAGIGKIPIIGDIVKAQSRNLLSGIAKNLLDKFLPSSISDGLNSTGNPELDEAKKHTTALQEIARNTSTAATISNSFSVTNSQEGLGKITGILKAIFGGRGTGTPTSGGGRVWQGLGDWKPDRNAGLNTGDINSAGEVVVKAGSQSTLSSIFGKGGIFGEKGFGNNAGTYGAVGAGMNLVGGLVGGTAGSAISMAGTGLSIGFMFGGPMGAAIGAGIGAVGGLLMGLFGRNKQRKADERTRNQAMMDAFSAMDKLISDVNSDKIDGASALSQADEIRANYVTSMSALKDKKARQHALADVSRIDAKIATLKAAVSAQSLRKEKMSALVPTFAGGVNMNSAFRNQYDDFKRHNGFLNHGVPNVDSIPALLMKGEIVANPRQQERMRRAAGFDVIAHAGLPNYNPPKMAAGASVGDSFGDSFSAFSVASSPSGGNGGGVNVEVKNNVIINGDGTATVKTEVFEIDSPQGRRNLMKTIEEEIYIERGQKGVSKALNNVNGGRV